MLRLPSQRAARWVGPMLDLLAIGLLAAGVARAWPALPLGDHASAALLNGPDAGEWALNALKVVWGDLASVDPHRMPTFVLLLAAAHRFEPDLARAGHAIGAAAWALQVGAVYLLGRMSGGRLVGLLAGALVLACAPLLHAASRFGVDPVLAAVLPLALVAVGPVRRLWPLAILAGAFGALASATHLSALPYTVPALLLLFWRGVAPPAPLLSRWGALALYGVGALFVFGLLDHLFGLIDGARLGSAVAEGITGTGGVRLGDSTRGDAAVASLVGGGRGAWAEAVRAALQPFWWRGLPWPALGALLALGVLGPGLAVPRPQRQAAARAPTPRLPRALRYRLPADWRRRIEAGLARARARVDRPAGGRLDRVLGGLDLRHGLPLLACLAPLPVLAAAGAEPRYSANLLPFVAVLLARGAVGPLRALAGRWPTAIWTDWAARSPAHRARLGAALALGALLAPWVASRVVAAQAEAIARIPQTDPVAEGARLLAVELAARFPRPGGVATPVREAAAHLGRPFCPRSSCVAGASGLNPTVCIAHLREECEGYGPIPLVWLERGPLGMGDDATSQALGAWAAERYGVTSRLETRAFDAVLISVPRVEPPAASLTGGSGSGPDPLGGG